MKKVLLGLACIAGLSACADGTGQVLDPRYRFGSDRPYDEYRASREMALTGQGAVPQTVPKKRPFDAPAPEEIKSPTAYQRVSSTTATATGRAPTGGGYYDPDTGQMLPSNMATLSQSMASAAPVPAATATAAAPAAAQPAPAPVKTETDALARYAASQSQLPGTEVYSRAGGSEATAAHACARYPNAEAAQLMFLTSGGPQQDPMGMDPDGDGFVCGWDPTYYMAERR